MNQLLEKDIALFSERKVKAKDIFYISQVSKTNAYEFIRKYHYLGDAKFFSVYQFGLFYKKTTELVGCATFSLPQGISALESWFNLSNDTTNIFELSRLCMLPNLNNTNASSFLLGGSIKMLNQMNEEKRREFHKEGKAFQSDDYVCRAVITLADASRHCGSIYQVCNFTYCGITSPANDFYREDGAKNPRGKSSLWHGVYLPRTQKHRYVYILDKSLHCSYSAKQKPTLGSLVEKRKQCCENGIVYDSRFDEYWTCPICTGRLQLVDKQGNLIENPRLSGVQVKERKEKDDTSFSRFDWDF